MRNWHFMNAIARLKPGVTLADANADLNRIADDIRRRIPDSVWRAVIMPLTQELVGKSQRTVWLLLAAGVVDPAVDEWLRDGVRRYLASDGEISLEQALGLPRRRPAKAVRDFWLAAAANHFTGTPWQRAAALADAVGNFGLRTWPSWCERKAPPEYADALHRALFHAFKTGLAMPATTLGLHKILANQNPVSI
jgi:hypothetical protein